jgi:hypothetical protein
LGKRKITNEGNLDNMILPSSNDVLGEAIKMLGPTILWLNARMVNNGYAESGANLRGCLDSRRRYCFGFTLGFPI